MKVVGAIVAIFGVILLFNFMPNLTDSTHELQTDAATQSFAAVTTGAGETAADVVLTVDPYKDRTTSITSITSDNVLDVDPLVAATYTTATNTLHVTGLVASQSRTLTVNYEIDALTDFTMMGTIVSWTPVLIVIGALAVVGGVILAMIPRRA